MSKEKKKSGCFGTLLKLVAVIFLLGILAAIFAPKHESDSPPAPSSQTSPSSQEPSQQVPVATPTQPTQQPFDILGVEAKELPKITKLTEPVQFSIAGGKGSTTAPAGSQVNVVSRSGDQIEIFYLDGKESVPYTKTTIQADILRLREDAKNLEADRIARGEQEKKTTKDYDSGVAVGEKSGKKWVAMGGNRPESAGVNQIARNSLPQVKPQDEADWLKGFKFGFARVWDSKWEALKQEIEADAGEEPSDAEARTLVKMLHKAKLSDPDSAKYESWSDVQYTKYSDGKYAWCITTDYRSKNVLGGYARTEATALIRNKRIIGIQGK